MSVNNGRRVQISLDGYAGQAGLVELEDRDIISFPTGSRPIHAPAGSLVTVEGAERTVLSSTASPFLPRFKVIELERPR